MKVLITGVSGQLGKELIESKPKDVEIIAKSRSLLDLVSKESCLQAVIEHRPDWVINSAAYTNVEKAEEEKELAYAVNSLAPKYFSEALNEYGGNLLQISTDYVFDGKKGQPYLPTDEKNPLSVYGFTKAKGEDYALQILNKHKKVNIIRTSWLISPYGNNFAIKVIKAILKKKELRIIYDQIGSPTSTKLLANACWKTIALKRLKNSIPEIMHVCNSGIASWYDIAFSIADIGSKMKLFDDKYSIHPILSSDYKSKANRPTYSVLDSIKTFKKLSLQQIHWRNSLELILDELKESIC